ncbi:MAG: hypothetical protein U0V02_15170 [Anaerolineales bacterium]
MDQNFHAIQQRVRRYWFKDGIGEMMVGGLFLLLALYFAGHRWLPSDTNAPMYLDGSLVIILIVGIFFTRKLIGIFKANITYPRTGYVEYYPGSVDTVPARIFIFFSALGFGLLLVVIGRYVGTFQWLPAFLGILLGVILIIIRTRAIDLNRFYYLAAASMILGVAASLSGLPAHYSISLYYALFGFVLIFLGGKTLAKYLRENPLPDGAPDE